VTSGGRNWERRKRRKSAGSMPGDRIGGSDSNDKRGSRKVIRHDPAPGTKTDYEGFTESGKGKMGGPPLRYSRVGGRGGLWGWGNWGRRKQGRLAEIFLRKKYQGRTGQI